MHPGHFLTACVLLALAGTAAPAQPGKRLPVLATIEGTVANDRKPVLETGFIAGEGKWSEVWTRVRPMEKPPEVDFARHFLLVSARDAADPNHRSGSVLKDERGVVTLNEISTLIGFQPSDRTLYRFYKLTRDGVTGVRRLDPAKKQWVVDPLPKEAPAPGSAGPLSP